MITWPPPQILTQNAFVRTHSSCAVTTRLVLGMERIKEEISYLITVTNCQINSLFVWQLPVSTQQPELDKPNREKKVDLNWGHRETKRTLQVA